MTTVKVEEIKETDNTETQKETTKKTRTKKTIQTKKEVKSKSTINKELRANAKDIDVEVQSLVKGEVFYCSRKTGEILELSEIGDREIISLDLLMDISKRCKKLLSNLVISISDIYSEDYKLEDIIEFFGLKDLYSFKEMTLEEIDDFILNTDLTEFEKEFTNIQNENLKFRLIERSVGLVKEGLLDSTAKMKLFEVAYGTEYLYKNI